MPPFKHKPVSPPLKWHGGKYYLADWIISLMPPRGSYLHYVEPYFGGGSVLLRNDPEGLSEVANDLNKELTTFWCAIKDPATFPEFCRLASLTPFSEVEYDAAVAVKSYMKTDLDKAANFFIRCRQSYAGRMKEFTSITKRRTRSGMNAEVSAWLGCVEGLPEVHARMRRVLILNRPALDVIRQQDGPKTLFYLDPPYLHETRVTTGEYGENEMTEKDHEELLKTLLKVEGRFLLSGYSSAIYSNYAARGGWQCHHKKISNNASSAKTKPTMTELVWTNY